MENRTSAKIISTTIKNNSLEITNTTKTKQNDRTAISRSSKTKSLELLPLEIDNFQDNSDRICHNWLKAHKTESLCPKNVQGYTKIVILLQNIVELIARIKTTIQCAQLQKQMVSETVGNIVSNCLDIEPEHVTPTANLANDLGMDSLSWQELLITLEERFAIQISDEIAGTLVTVQELIERVVLIIQAKNKQSLQLQL
ncbi:acyl carrier protein [Pleurocapsa sp. CCALA 161]|uniref:acyl carrier protein n=1 Tax=Pleurocapsa sp. CCALA 161 TaxID=2107688 RepID=UPI0018EE32A4|nr:acyl carrier protein [Pleurocapsa sp. CCALA 161]